MPTFTNLAAYKFTPLTGLKPLRERLLGLCRDWNLRGTILLSPEGINLFVAGPADAVGALLAELRALPGLADLPVKLSPSDHQPFNRMLVRLKREIIAFGVEGIDPAHHPTPKLPPQTLKQWLDEGRPVVLLDTRNDYEVKLGTFRNARPIGVNHFRDFPKAVARLPQELKEAPIVMFCTGGIRCEKAGPFMEREGFRNVHQLDGGILKYFEECGGAHYDGECFVFDQRVGVDPGLHPTDSTQCFACLSPLTADEQRDPRYVPGKSCPHCFRTPEQELALTLNRRHEAIRRATHPLPGSLPYDNFRPVNIPAAGDKLPLAEALALVVRHIPAAEWTAACERGRVLDARHQPMAATTLVRAGERYLHKLPDLVEPPVNAGLRILHEDRALIIVNKPAPLPMHPSGRFNRNTLQHILHTVYHPEKPHPAHRLDANTTGVVVLTRTRHFAGRLQPQLAAGKFGKIYLARVQGHPREDDFACDAPITGEPGEVGSREVDLESGQPALTRFRVLARFPDDTALLEARPVTGRTNQIRVHLWHLGHSICGDPLYLPGRQLGETQTLPMDAPPLCLHSWRVSFTHPLTGEPVEFTAPPPDWASPSFQTND